MPRNIELKVACDADHIAAVRDRLNQRPLSAIEHVSHVDTYFRVLRGRLKLREIDAGATSTAELIQYDRPNDAGSRTSTYQRVAIAPEHAVTCRVALASALGILVTVRKQRAVAIWRSTRIHLDMVEGLGQFVELETVIGDCEGGEERGYEEFVAVMKWLGLAGLESIPGSYSDLLIEKESTA